MDAARQASRAGGMFGTPDTWILPQPQGPFSIIEPFQPGTARHRAKTAAAI